MSSVILTLEDWLEALKKSKKLIIVEGKKDAASLLALGLNNKIYPLNKKPLYVVVEEVATLSKEVVILTDLDRTGKRLYSKLNSDLQQRGVFVDNVFREFLFKNTKLRQIEGLAHYAAEHSNV